MHLSCKSATTLYMGSEGNEDSWRQNYCSNSLAPQTLIKHLKIIGTYGLILYLLCVPPFLHILYICSWICSNSFHVSSVLESITNNFIMRWWATHGHRRFILQLCHYLFSVSALLVFIWSTSAPYFGLYTKLCNVVVLCMF